MPVVVADIVLVRKQVLEKLLASPVAARYTDAIGANAQHPILQEITDTILLIDQGVCTDIISTAGHPYRSFFMVPSAALLSGDFVPTHVGEHGDVQVSISGVYDFSTPAKSRDDILRMRQHVALYGKRREHFIEDDVCHHAGDFAKVWYPSFTKTSLCQSPQNYEDVLIYGSVQLNQKDDANSSFFKDYRALYEFSAKLVRSRHKTIPPQEELMLAIKDAR